MANGKAFPQAVHDFAKTNGVDAVFNTVGPSLTRQEFAEECDINNLMKRYEGHNQSINYLMNMPAQGGRYVDFADLPQDLMGYMQFMAEAETAFMSLPAIVRKEFDNDPVQFVEFASDPENLEQMRKWDLAPPARPAEKPAGAAVSSPTAPAGPVPSGAAEAPPAPPTHAST